MKKVSALFVGLSLLTLTLTLTLPAHAAGEPIKIGDINAYSAMPVMVEGYKNGVDLALDEINQAGGVLGRPLEVISRDSKLLPAEGIKHAQELASREGVSVLTGCGGSGVTLAVSSWADKNNIAFIETSAVSDSAIWENWNKHFFRITWGGYMYMSSSIDKAIELYGDKIKGKKWAFVSPNLEYGHAVLNIAQKIADERGLQATWLQPLWSDWGKLDAGATITALKQQQPDVVISMFLTSDLTKFIREGSKRKFFANKIVIAPQLAAPEHLNTLKNETPKGWISVGFPVEDLKTPAFLEFKDKYQAKYHQLPMTYSMMGYNVVHAIAKAIEQAGSDNPEKIRAALETVSFITPTGEQSFRSIDHQANVTFWVGTTDVVNGEAKLAHWTQETATNHSPSDAWILEQRTNANTMK
ncbi:MAG: ABC transporter substrate-binding protein [Alphaproteobacteria bacterium]|nr:ABC transporter substrate-binding protein [Alphaproteobacteria bacterium]